jgi:hypothetical protein
VKAKDRAQPVASDGRKQYRTNAIPVKTTAHIITVKIDELQYHCDEVSTFGIELKSLLTQAMGLKIPYDHQLESVDA